MKHQSKHAAWVALGAIWAAVDPLFGPFHSPRILSDQQVIVDFGLEEEVSTEAFTR